MSGKGFNLSLFGLNDNQGKIDVSIFKKISNGLQNGTMSAQQLRKAMKELSPEAYKTAKAINMSGKDAGGMSKAFLGASKSLDKAASASKIAAVGMQALSMAANMALMAGISLVLSLPSRIAQAQEEAKKNIKELLRMIMKEHSPYEHDYSEVDE